MFADYAEWLVAVAVYGKPLLPWMVSWAAQEEVAREATAREATAREAQEREAAAREAAAREAAARGTSR